MRLFLLLFVSFIGTHFTVGAFSYRSGKVLKSWRVNQLDHSRSNTFVLKESLGHTSETETHVMHDVDRCDDVSCLHQRRSVLNRIVSSSISFSAASLASNVVVKEAALATKPDIQSLLMQLKEARAQLEPVPTLIKEEKWDSVRAILITPPLADCWAKTSKPLLKLYAQAQDELPNGDELTALELREEALDHLRFLDMAVYNNVFNPIKSEGETGATKELIRSYYEDPVNEYKQCVRILDDLITLAK